MHFRDLSSYSYLNREGSPAELNIGWLDSSHEFPTWTPQTELLRAIWGYSKFMAHRTRGIHFCELCPKEKREFIYNFDNEELKLGSAEIRVFSNNGVVYAAPNLIFHYLRDHNYKPPEEFIEAALNGPRPGSEKYISLMKEHGFLSLT